MAPEYDTTPAPRDHFADPYAAAARLARFGPLNPEAPIAERRARAENWELVRTTVANEVAKAADALRKASSPPSDQAVVEAWAERICERGDLDEEHDKEGHDWHSLWAGFVIGIGRPDLTTWQHYQTLGYPQETKAAGRLDAAEDLQRMVAIASMGRRLAGTEEATRRFVIAFDAYERDTGHLAIQTWGRWRRWALEHPDAFDGIGAEHLPMWLKTTVEEHRRSSSPVQVTTKPGDA